MIKINLLPVQYQKKLKLLNYLNNILPYLFLGLLFLLVLNLFFGSLILQKNFSLGRLKSVWGAKGSDFKEIASLKERLFKFGKEYQQLQGVFGPEVSFSKIMYLIYKNLPLNIWFKEFSFKEGSLSIKGAVLDYEKDVSLSLKDFVENLKKTREIVEVFPKINIVSQEIKRLKDRGVLYFELTLGR